MIYEFYKFTNCIIKKRDNYLIEMFEKRGNEFITNLIHYKFKRRRTEPLSPEPSGLELLWRPG